MGCRETSEGPVFLCQVAGGLDEGTGSPEEEVMAHAAFFSGPFNFLLLGSALGLTQ